MPGSGKSASAFLLANELEQKGVMSMTMPHDGYHYTIDYLKSFVHSDDVIYRRGAPDTFDPASLYRDMDRIRNNPLGEDLIKVPGFDHAKGDPEPDQHVFDRRHHDVVICEGLYLLHDEDGWSDIKELLDFSIFMESDVDICVERVKIRNQCIPGYSREEIIERAEKVDRINAITVLASKHRADVIVESTAKKTVDC
jgi:pantothenate kinase